MSWLLVSNILLWIAFISVSVVCLALARQIGVLYERVAPAGALMLENSVAPGSDAPRLDVTTLTGAQKTVGVPQVAGRSQLLFFLSPDCPVCKTLLPVLRSVTKAESNWIDVILASDGESQDHVSFVESYDLSDFPYVVSKELGMTYGVSKLPYGVLIDEESKIVTSGIINSREHLESLFEAKDLQVTSIQDYLDKRQVEARRPK
ncbi:MAG: methylamine dehydrogenase accessory protein MauD [Pseudomonadota bacterium]